MQVIVALENVIKTYTFPDDASIQFNGPHGFVMIEPKNGHPHFFNTAYIIALTPGTKAGG